MAELVKREKDIVAVEAAQHIEQYINGKTKQQYEQCQSLMPEVKTADDYSRMTLGDLVVDKLARKSAIARLEAMGCIPRGSSNSEKQIKNFVSCTTFGYVTSCSDGTSYTTIGNVMTGSNGLNCTKFGATMNCSKF